MTADPRRRPVALALLFVLIWTSAFPAAKIGLADCPPLLFLAARFGVAGALLAAWSLARGGWRRPAPREWAALALLGLLNHGLYLGLSWSAMQSVSSGLAAIVISANPLLVALLAARLLGEPLGARLLAGLLLGMAGVAWLVRHRVGAGIEPGTGVALLFAALLSLALGTVLYKRLRVALPLGQASALQLLFAAAWVLPVALAREDLALVRPSMAFVLSFAWMVAVVSIGAYLIWFWLLERGSAGAVSAWLFLSPPLGLLAGAALLGEPCGWADLVGIVPVGAAIVLATRPGRRPLTSAGSTPAAAAGR